MNKERFHNILALHLGREIVMDKRLQIKVEWQEPNSPWIEVRLTNIPIEIRIYANEVGETGWKQQLSDEQKSIISDIGLTGTIAEVARAASAAYDECCQYRF